MNMGHVGNAFQRVRFRNMLRITLMFTLVPVFGISFSSPSAIATSRMQAAASHLEVRIIIESVRSLDDIDGPLSNPDFYPVVAINGEEFNNKAGVIEDKSNISPNWQFFDILESPASQQVQLMISIYDEDGALRGDDEHVDVNTNPGRALDFFLNLDSCALIGSGVTGICGNTLTSTGRENDRAEVKFRVEVKPVVPVKFTLTVEEVSASDCAFGTFCDDPADFYARVKIDDQELDNREGVVPNKDKITPNWEFSKDIDRTRNSIPLAIAIYDDDGNNDDHADLKSTSGRDLNLTLDINACLSGGDSALIGDINGQCDVTLVSKGNEDESVEIKFRVELEPPPTTPGTNVRCLHNLIWPQAGDTVTIIAEALNGERLPTTKSADIEIWFNNREVPLVTAPYRPSLSAPVGPFNEGDSFSYGCLVRDKSNGEEVWSGWRRVQVGQPATGRVVPLIYTGSRSSSVDLVFVADRDNYSGPNDATFIADVKDIIHTAYYSESIYLAHQDKLNFWIALDTGLAEDSNEGCDHQWPGQNNFSSPPNPISGAYAFADSSAIVHRNEERLGRSFRDCAPSGERVFSADKSDSRWPRVFLHETGHRPFGLADEYCNKRNPPAGGLCDGGYFQNNPFPNLYEEPEDCLADIVNLQTWDERLGDEFRGPSHCKEFVEDEFWFFDKDWSVSDPHQDDLMVDNGKIRGADARRIEWIFNQCAQASCGPTLINAMPEGRTALLAADPRQEPVPEFDFQVQATSKSIAVNLDFVGREQVSLNSAAVNYGQSYARLGDPPLLRVRLLDNDGNLVEEHNAWHPLWEFVWNNGKESRIVRDAGTGTFVFPFSRNLKTMEVIDLSTQKKLITVDLRSSAIIPFCKQHPNDQDCLSYFVYLPLITRPPGLPDLVTSLNLSSDMTSYAAGEPVTITAVINNQGKAPAAPFWVDLFINPKSLPTAANTIWSDVCNMSPCFGIAWKVDGLAEGGQVTLTSTLGSYAFGHTIWPGWFASGTTDLYLYVDTWNPGVPQGSVLESDETNNRFELHDLDVTGPNPPYTSVTPASDLPPRPMIGNE